MYENDNLKLLLTEECKNKMIEIASETFYKERFDEAVVERLLYLKQKYKVKTWFTLIGWINDERAFVSDFTDESFVEALDNLEEELKQF